MLPVLMRPRGVSLLVLGAFLAVGPVVSRAMRSGFLLGETGACADAGIENPRTVDVGRAFFDVEEPADWGVWRSDAHDFLMGAGETFTVVGAVSAVATDEFASVGSAVSKGLALLGVSDSDTDVLVDTGEPGRVGVSVISVAEEDGTVEVA